MSGPLRLETEIGKPIFKTMPQINYYPNATRILEEQVKVAESEYEKLRENCIKDKAIAGKAQEQYDIACELRHAAAVLRQSKPSGIL